MPGRAERTPGPSQGLPASVCVSLYSLPVQINCIYAIIDSMAIEQFFFNPSGLLLLQWNSAQLWGNSSANSAIRVDGTI